MLHVPLALGLLLATTWVEAAPLQVPTPAALRSQIDNLKPKSRIILDKFTLFARRGLRNIWRDDVARLFVEIKRSRALNFLHHIKLR